MHERARAQWMAVAGVAALCFAGCGTIGTTPIVECTDSITVTVSGDTLPTFSWTPDCTIGRLVVEEGVEERWGTETTGASLYRSPIVYGVAPPGASKDEPPQPLFFGSTYTVSLWRFFSVKPESLVLLGSASWTPVDPESLQAGRTP
jgi:hypothetical protein